MPPKKKRRGRPPKVKESQLPVVPKKRGRPFKNPPQSLPTEKKKRGRPFKNQPTPTATKPKVRAKRVEKVTPEKPIKKKEVVVDTGFGSVEGKMFLSHRDSKIPKFQSWYKQYLDVDPQNNGTDINGLSEVISKLQDVVNDYFIENSIDLSIRIPVMRLMLGEKITKIFFMPEAAGVTVEIYYKVSSVPSGASPSTKTTLVCNQFNSAVRSVFPLGVSG